MRALHFRSSPPTSPTTCALLLPLSRRSDIIASPHQDAQILLASDSRWETPVLSRTITDFHTAVSPIRAEVGTWRTYVAANCPSLRLFVLIITLISTLVQLKTANKALLECLDLLTSLNFIHFPFSIFLYFNASPLTLHAVWNTCLLSTFLKILLSLIHLYAMLPTI